MKTLEGIVVSVAMQKTAVVRIERQVVHPLYKKRYKKRKTYKVDTGEFSVVLGDTVKIVQTKPLSKEKYFKIVEIAKDKK